MVKKERVGRTLILRLDDPKRRNPLSQSLIQKLLEALDEAEADPEVRSLILTGEGPAFSAGADLEALQRLREQSAEENLEDSKRLMRLFVRVYTFPKPVLAALNGPAIAGGAGLASVCDLVVMSQTAKLGYTEARIGFVAALVAVFLLRMVGERQARELLLSARLISAEEALARGLVNRVVPPEELLPQTLSLAQELEANSPTSLSTTKELLSHLSGLGLDESLRLALFANAWIRQGEDLAEGLQAFFERRPPRF
jgi:methylglutaconyl-CoA hydratase